jgi:hypothetical protein
MLALKESMLSNENRIVSELALTATAFTTRCPSDDCTGGGHIGASRGGCDSGSGYHGYSGRNNRNRGGGRGTSRGDGGNNANANSSRYPTPHGPWVCFNSYTQGTPKWRRPPRGTGLLGHALLVPIYVHDLRSAAGVGLVAALNNMAPPSQVGFGWVVDFGGTSHKSSDNGIVPPLLPLPYPVYVTVGNGAWVPVHFYSDMHLCLPSSNFVLKSVLRVPSLIQNLISVHQFTCVNVVTIQIDLFVFSVKDLRTRLKVA